MLVEPRRIGSRIEPVSTVGVLPTPVVIATTVLFKAGMMLTPKPTFIVFVAATILLTTVGPLPLCLLGLLTLMTPGLLLLVLPGGVDLLHLLLVM